MAKIALFGSTGRIGQRILNEALARGHEVTAIVRDATRKDDARPNLSFKPGDILKPESVAVATAGQDIVISAYGPGAGDPKQLVTAAEALIEGVSTHPGIRVVIVGGAGSLEVSHGVQLVDRPDFPSSWKGTALAHREALEVYRKSPIDWTYVSPAAFIEPGTRTGQYRIGTDQLLTDQNGDSKISMEDYAKAIVDEIEKQKFRRQRFTVAY